MQDQAGKTFDVIVVGSGASGGWAAKRMTEAGLSVALLDAGRDISPSTFTEHQAAYSLPYRDRAPEPKTTLVDPRCRARRLLRRGGRRVAPAATRISELGVERQSFRILRSGHDVLKCLA